MRQKMLRGALKPVAVTLLAFGILSTIPSNVGSSYTLKGCCTHINEINLPVHLFFLVWLLTACLFVFHVGWLTRSCILSQRHSRACRAAPAVKRMFTCFAKNGKQKDVAKVFSGASDMFFVGPARCKRSSLRCGSLGRSLIERTHFD